MVPTPENIRALRGDGVLEIRWSDGVVHRLGFKYLRSHCPCAGCVNEFTGVRTLDVESIPESIQPEAIETVGNYALRIGWSDRHNTGIYTWERLRELGEAANQA